MTADGQILTGYMSTTNGSFHITAFYKADTPSCILKGNYVPIVAVYVSGVACGFALFLLPSHPHVSMS